jgi:hypothetical protein
MAGAKRRARVACLVIAVTRLSKQLNTCDWKCITKALPPKPVAVLGADHSNRGSRSLQKYQALLTAESHHRRFGGV